MAATIASGVSRHKPREAARDRRACRAITAMSRSGKLLRKEGCLWRILKGLPALSLQKLCRNGVFSVDIDRDNFQ